MIDNAQPINPKGSAIVIKLIVWLILWIIFSAVVFLVIAWLWSTIDLVVKNASQWMTFTPLVWLSIMWIALIISLIWMIVLSIIYNVLWPDDYYDVKLMTSGILSVNLLLVIIFLIFYVYVWSVIHDINKLFLVYGFHLFFSIFVSLIIVDLIKNPNYSTVYIIWNSFGFIFALLIFFIIYDAYSSQVGWVDTKNILFYPPILSFSIIPFISTIWEKIYYRFYEMWNDFLYVPSLSEIMVDEVEEDDVNVEI